MKIKAMTVVLVAACGAPEDEDCPENETRDPADGRCYCDPGFERRSDQEACTSACPVNTHPAPGGCECDNGYAEGRDGDCVLATLLTACCECLDRTLKEATAESCSPISVTTCEAQTTPLVTTCYCWEQCYTYCSDTLYPYDEPPNACQH